MSDTRDRANSGGYTSFSLFLILILLLLSQDILLRIKRLNEKNSRTKPVEKKEDKTEKKKPTRKKVRRRKKIHKEDKILPLMEEKPQEEQEKAAGEDEAE